MAIILIITRLELETITKTNFLISISYHTTTRFILLLMTAKIDLKKKRGQKGEYERDEHGICESSW
jgi:hypothetical protein